MTHIVAKLFGILVQHSFKDHFTLLAELLAFEPQFVVRTS